MNETVITLGTIFIAYLIYIYSRFGILSSISESYYKLKEAGNKWLFIIFMYSIGICLLLVASFNLQPMVWTFFLAGSGAAFVGIAAQYRDNMTEQVHIGATLTLIFFSLLGLGLVFGSWWPTYFLIVGSLVMLVLKPLIKQHGYWVEVLAFVCIWGGLLLV